ncbi:MULTISPECIES: RidA family protein [Acetobacter]|jgi:enamine deaminase RidA (YjgF/YER057c/UK114 family)|uniref:RidA family protein n=1 Tax=Acetobacter TaxID=434 RepID=UPI0037707625
MRVFKAVWGLALCTTSVLAASVSFAPAYAQSDLVRHNEATFPIASAIEVPPGSSTIYLSGMGAPVIDPKAPQKSLAAYGDMATQTEGALKRIEDTLAGMGLTMGDVVQMHVFMVADTKTKKLDFEGMMKGYTKFFGTKSQPNLPVRSAFGVAQLANPGWLVEIEVVAVRPSHH